MTTHETSNRAELTVKTKPQKCVDADATRYALGNLQAIPSTDNKTWLCATDGRKLAAVLVDGRTDETRLVPAKILSARHKSTKATLNGRWENDKGQHIDKEPEGMFPKVRDVLPKIVDGNYLQVSLDANFIHELKQALNTDNHGAVLNLLIPKPEKSDHVDGAVYVVGERGIGVVMPCTHDKRSTPVKEYNRMAQQFARDCDK